MLGAIVSPTDPLAATAIGRRLGVPRRPLAIIEGESLVNDGTALVLFKFAVAAVVAGTFSLLHASGALRLDGASAASAIGLVVGYVIRLLRRRLDNPPLEVTIAFLTGYFAFLPGVGARRLRRARGRHGRRLHGLAHAGADDGRDAAPGRRAFWSILTLPDQRAAVRARRPAAAADPRPPRRASRPAQLIGYARRRVGAS